MKALILLRAIENTQRAIERNQQMIDCYVPDANLFRDAFNRHIRRYYPIEVLGIRLDPVLAIISQDPQEYESGLDEYVSERKPDQIAKHDLSYCNILDRLERLERHLQALLFLQDSTIHDP